jgi:serine/threonine-protein kinase
VSEAEELPFEPLDLRLERGSLEIDEVVEIARMLAVHLDAMHERNSIDGAIVPARIEVKKGGAPRLAEAAGEHQRQKAYLAPEAWEGHPVPASDLFSMAAILYESLCGGRAFPGDDSAKIRVSITTGSRVPLAARVPGLADAVDEDFAKALSFTPEDRYPSCAAFADALVSAIERSREAPLVQKPTSRSSRPPSWRPPMLDDDEGPPIPWLKVFVGLALLAAIAAVLAIASSK